MLRLSSVFTLLIFLAGCAETPPVVDFVPGTDFTKYKTFAFISEHPLLLGEGTENSSPLLEGRLMNVTENILTARGFKRVADRESADIAVAFTLGGREKIQVNSYPEPYRAYYGGWGHRGGYYSGVGMSTSTSVQQYQEGTLIIDIYDVAEHAPIWHGKATKKVTKKMQNNPQETVVKIVSNILATFPPM